MKKRILAFMLCMALCIVPLPFSVNAAEIVDGKIIPAAMETRSSTSSDDVLCGCMANCTPFEYGTMNRGYSGTAEVCYYQIYSYVKATCDDCGEVNIFYNISQYYDHPGWVEVTLDDGKIHQRCPYCGYTTP